MLKKRVITALWGIPLLVVIVWFGEPFFTIAIAIFGILAVFEFYRLVAANGTPPLTYFGLVWTLLFILSGNRELQSFLEPHFDITLLTPIILTSAVVLSLIWLLRHPLKEKTFAGWAWTMAGILYVGWLLSYLIALRGFDSGQDWSNWVFLALFVTFASDTAAYFVGRAFGSHHLAPNISPGKTWEGTFGGILGAIIVSLFFILPTPFNLNLHWWQAVLLGLLVSVFGQLGDLVESLFKRKTGVKDTSQLIPGHGGALDRLDSVVFAGVVVYYYAYFTAL